MKCILGAVEIDYGTSILCKLPTKWKYLDDVFGICCLFRRVFASTVAKNVPIVSYSACEANYLAFCMVESLSCSDSFMPMKSYLNHRYYSGVNPEQLSAESGLHVSPTLWDLGSKIQKGTDTRHLQN